MRARSREHMTSLYNAYACPEMHISYLPICETKLRKSLKRANRAAAAHTSTKRGQHSTDWAAIQTSLGNSNLQQPPETSPPSSQETRIHSQVKGEPNEQADRQQKIGCNLNHSALTNVVLPPLKDSQG